MASSGYDPLPSSSDPPPAYDPSPAAGLVAGYPPGSAGYPPGSAAYPPGSAAYPPGSANQAYVPYKDPCAGAATSAYPGSYQAGGPYGAYPVATSAVPPGYQQDTTYVHMIQPGPNVIVIGGCPACRVGVLEDEYPCLGICCAIVFFPVGILCCLAMKQRHCPNCGAVFG